MEDQKRTQIAQVNKCEQLFMDSDRELSGIAITPTEGFLQITNISNINESVLEEIKHQRLFMFEIHDLNLIANFLFRNFPKIHTR